MKEFIGYEKIIEGFFRRVDNGTLSHAHLIIGPNGIGKSILARIFALKILNKEKDIDYVDIVNYRPSKASMGVDEVREIIEEVSKRPYEGDKKVIIIHEGSKLTIQAQNALLKTIEEPPQGVYIILLAESLETLLETIKSRCQVYKLTPLTKDELYKYIAIKGYDYSEEEKSSAIAFSEGVPGRIDRYFNDDKLRELRNNIVILIKNLNKNDLEAILQQEESFSNLKNDKEEVLNIFGLFIRDILINKEIENEEFIINSDKLEDIKELTKEMSFKKLNNMIKTIEEARRNIKSNVSWGMTLRVMLMGFMEG